MVAFLLKLVFGWVFVGLLVDAGAVRVEWVDGELIFRQRNVSKELLKLF